MYDYMLRVMPDLWGNPGAVYVIKNDGTVQAINYNTLAARLSNGGTVDQKDLEHMAGFAFRLKVFAPEKMETPPKEVFVMDGKTVEAYRLEGEDAKDTLLWRTGDIGQIEVLNEIRALMR